MIRCLRKKRKFWKVGSGQGPVLGTRNVRDLALCRAEKEEQVLMM